MKHSFTSLLILLSIVYFLSSCSTFDKMTIEGRELDFHSYIAFGDEYTAGYMNKGLYRQGQENSFPNILAQKFNEIGNVSFVQPVIDGNGTGYLAIDSVIVPLCDELSSKVVFQQHDSLLNWQLAINQENSHRNMGLPKLRVSELSDNTKSHSNPFFRLIYDVSGEDISYLEVIDDTPIEFFTLWLGMNDVMEFAVSGGGDPSAIFTPLDTFEHHFSLLLSHITQDNPQATGVVANIPDITELPFFSTVPHEFIGDRPCNATVRSIYITTDQGVRIANEKDKILLSADSLLGVNGWGLHAQSPIPDHYVLDEEEVQEVQKYTLWYNEKIKLAVNKHNENNGAISLVFLDMWNEFHTIHQEGKAINGLNISGEFLSGGLYSLDGLFPTPRGNALIGNLFIDRLNAAFGYAIPNIDITEYKGVEFP